MSLQDEIDAARQEVQEALDRLDIARQNRDVLKRLLNEAEKAFEARSYQVAHARETLHHIEDQRDRG